MSDEPRQQIRLKVIPQPDHKTPALRIIGPSGDDTYEVQTLDEEPRLSCGACDNDFFVGIYPGTLRDVIFHCSNCGADNVADPLDDQRRLTREPEQASGLNGNMVKYTLKLRSLGRSGKGLGPLTESDPSYLDKVEGLPEGEEAWITEKDGNWQISRKKNGVRENWAGDYKSAQDALAALQKIVNSENPMRTGPMA